MLNVLKFNFVKFFNDFKVGFIEFFEDIKAFFIQHSGNPFLWLAIIGIVLVGFEFTYKALHRD